MTNLNAIIIGGGLGGLTAGATLSKLGKKVLLLEQHSIPGGCATAFKRKDFVMEVGLHEMDGLYGKDTKLEIFNFLEVNKFVEFEKVPELFHLKSDKIEFTFPHGTESSQNMLIERFPHETKGIILFFKLINGVTNEIARIPREKWKANLLLPFMPLLFPNTVRVSKTSVGEWVDKYIGDENLKLILLTNLLYYGDDPYTMSLMYFSLAQAGYINGGGHFIKGGSRNLSDFLSDYINSHGGHVLLGKKVEKILVEKGKACGVQYSDAFNTGSKPVDIYADVIIANAAIPLVTKMLPVEYRPRLENRIRNLEESCSLISIYMGFDTDLKKLGVKHYSTFIQGDDVKSIKDIKENNHGDWSKKGFVFVDYSQVDSALAPQGKSVAVICAADYLSEWEGLNEAAYKTKKEHVAQLFFQKLEIHFPGILNHLVHYDVGTAKTIQRYTLNPKGAPYGYAQTPSQSGMGRMESQSPVKNLFFASAWSFPGGGFTGAILSGFLSAMSIDKKIKWGSYDSHFMEDSRIVKLLKKQIIAENTIELTFEKPSGFCHKPGQYAILRLNQPKETELDLPFRSLSIVSHPDEPSVRFAMRMSDSSFKKNCSRMEAGEEVTIFGPTGKFGVRPESTNIVFLIAGIGITPIIPILKEIEINPIKGKVLLFHSYRTTSSGAYHNELKNMNIHNYTYVPVTTSTNKRIESNMLKAHLNDFNSYDYFLVGTTSFLSSMKQLLIKEGVDLTKINEDDFG